MRDEFEAFARLERLLGRLLLAGVTTASVLLLLGLVLQVVAPASSMAALFLTSGLLILMATPMLRIVVSIAEYVRMGEWFFVVTTSIVLAELAIGVLVALKKT